MQLYIITIISCLIFEKKLKSDISDFLKYLKFSKPIDQKIQLENQEIFSMPCENYDKWYNQK